MRISRPFIFAIALCVGVLLATGAAMAQDTYQGVRMWDSGPFQAWHGPDGNSPGNQIIAIRGATKSVQITYAPGIYRVGVAHFTDRVELTIAGSRPNNLAALTPVGPFYNYIVYCTNVDDEGQTHPYIICNCPPESNAVCDHLGPVSLAPSNEWYDM